MDLTIGPSIEEGFYYDCFLEDGRTLTDADKSAIEKRMQQASALCTVQSIPYAAYL